MKFSSPICSFVHSAAIIHFHAGINAAIQMIHRVRQKGYLDAFRLVVLVLILDGGNEFDLSHTHRVLGGLVLVDLLKEQRGQQA